MANCQVATDGSGLRVIHTTSWTMWHPLAHLMPPGEATSMSVNYP